MKIPVQKLYLTRRVEIGVVALFAAAAFLAEFAAAQSPVTNR
jgi:energy-converting hydrogenase Eha subunit C